MSLARNLARVIVDASGDIAAGNLDNAVPADGSITAAKLAASLDLSSKTLTYPDNSVQSADIASLAASKLSGQVPDANAPSGSVIQVVMGTAASQVTISTNTYTDIGLSASITPLSTSSKILVIATTHSHTPPNGNGYGIRLLRDSTEIWNPSPQDGTGPFYCYSGAGGGVWDNSNIEYLDSPNSTSNLTYKLQGRPYNAALGPSYFNYAGVTQGKASIILMEIAG